MLQLATTLEEFVVPDFAAPLSLDEYAAELPTGALSRGMFMTCLLEGTERQCGKRPAQAKDYVHFKEYPIRDFMYLAKSCAAIAYPRLPLREALRRFGHDVFPMLSETMVGRAIFGVALRDWAKTLDLASRGYSVSIKPGTATLVEHGPDHAIMQLRDVWSFPDCYQVGIFEGAMQVFHVRGRIKVRAISKCDADLLIPMR